MHSFTKRSKNTDCFRKKLIPFFGCALITVHYSAKAQTLDLPSKPLQFLISQTLVSDSNLFRQPDQTMAFQSDPVAGLISATRVQASWRGNAGMQSYDLQGSLDQLLYRNYPSINHLDYRLSGRWKMAFPDDWSGSTDLSFSKNQPARSELIGQEANSLLQTNFAVSLYKSLAPTFQGFTKLDVQRRDNSSQSRSNADFKFTALELGARYRPNVAQEASLAMRRSSGRYGTLAVGTDQFTEDTVSLSALSEQGSNNLITAQIGIKRRAYDQREDRNFSGPFFEMRYLVPISSVLTIDTRVGSGTDASSLTDSTYARGRNISIKPSWQVTDKTRLDSSLDYSHAKFVSRFDPLSAQRISLAKNESLQSLAVSATHGFSDTLSLSLRLANEQRRSTDLLRNFKAQSITLAVQLEL